MSSRRSGRACDSTPSWWSSNVISAAAMRSPDRSRSGLAAAAACRPPSDFDQRVRRPYSLCCPRTQPAITPADLLIRASGAWAAAEACCPRRSASSSRSPSSWPAPAGFGTRSRTSRGSSPPSSIPTPGRTRRRDVGFTPVRTHAASPGPPPAVHQSGASRRQNSSGSAQRRYRRDRRRCTARPRG